MSARKFPIAYRRRQWHRGWWDNNRRWHNGYWR